MATRSMCSPAHASPLASAGRHYLRRDVFPPSPRARPDPNDPVDLEAAREAGYDVGERPRDGDGRALRPPVPKEPTPAL